MQSPVKAQYTLRQSTPLFRAQGLLRPAIVIGNEKTVTTNIDVTNRILLAVLATRIINFSYNNRTRRVVESV